MPQFSSKLLSCFVSMTAVAITCRCLNCICPNCVVVMRQCRTSVRWKVALGFVGRCQHFFLSASSRPNNRESERSNDREHATFLGQPCPHVNTLVVWDIVDQPWKDIRGKMSTRLVRLSCAVLVVLLASNVLEAYRSQRPCTHLHHRPSHRIATNMPRLTRSLLSVLPVCLSFVESIYPDCL